MHWSNHKTAAFPWCSLKTYEKYLCIIISNEKNCGGYTLHYSYNCKASHAHDTNTGTDKCTGVITKQLHTLAKLENI